MKFIRILMFSLFFIPIASFGASNDFMVAAQLLAAAKNADIQQVQSLVNAGANVNFVDSTGLSIVCTALMNNDVRAAQILQMYGADASKCDTQIKKYNNRTKPRSSGGLFSGLSSAQSISLTAAGAAVVVGGLFLLTDLFDPGNNNDNPSSGGNRPGGDGSGGGAQSGGTVAFTLPYGPAMPTANDEYKFYTANLDLYSTTSDTLNYGKNFELMSRDYTQNYLLMMHGYSPLARGYMGMRTPRNSVLAPIETKNINWRGIQVMGGRPVNVALVTSNGVNADNFQYGVISESSLGDTLIPWTTVNKDAVNQADDTMISSKYYNNKIVLGIGEETLTNAVTVEDESILSSFDLAGWGTVVNNANASIVDNLLAKVVGGRDSGYKDADFMGFMPNGQMTIYRTGNGTGIVTPTEEITGTYTQTNGKITEIVLFGETLTVLQDGNTFVATDSGTENPKTYKGYIGTNGKLYIDSEADGVINQMYTMSDDGVLTLSGVAGSVDYMNYKALINAADLWSAGDISGGRSRPGVIANVSVVEALHAKDANTIDDVLSGENKQTTFSNYVNDYYDVVEDAYFPGTDAYNFFGKLGSSFQPMVIFATGASETDSKYSGVVQSATFENAVPLVFDNAKYNFMSVVSVGLTKSGTSEATDVSGFAPTGKYMLSQWQVGQGENAKYYKSRACGDAGSGTSNVDPWCFAGAGMTDERAVSSVAGAVGAVQSAFDYLSNKQVFSLLALTADGPLLATDATGKAMSEESLVSYLQNMYILPTEYTYYISQGKMDYLDAFAEVFGYGLINLERATKPGTSVYFFDGDRIVSANGDAYWRAATNTAFRASSALNLRSATISAPFFDVLESTDGKLSVPRIWENEFAFGATDSRGLYMGDVLGELKTVRDNSQTVKIGSIDFSMATSERAYDDYMGGLDNLTLKYNSGNWNFGASYQRYLTDGVSRFSGLQNPIMGLASNAVVSDAEYNYGRFAFGGRVFSGAITDEGLLETDPTISSQYMPAKLGLMQGADSYVAFNGDRLSVKALIGMANESDTLLGAYSDGLLDLGAGDTIYTDIETRYDFSDKIGVIARATFARTTSDASGNFILGLTDIDSNAFALGANIGNFEFSVSQPLAITDGSLKYAYAKYDVDDNSQLNIVDTHVADLSLQADVRETRFMGTYRHKFGEFTDGAFGFIYRVNPNHTDKFGNESVFMLKMTHKLGI